MVYRAPSFPAAPRSRSCREDAVQPELLTARQAAQLLGISIRSLHNNRSNLPSAITLSPKLVRWRKADLLEFIAGLHPNDEPRNEPGQLRAARQRRLAGKSASDASATKSGQVGQAGQVPTSEGGDGYAIDCRG